jgi:hypothetical protein
LERLDSVPQNTGGLHRNATMIHFLSPPELTGGGGTNNIFLTNMQNCKAGGIKKKKKILKKLSFQFLPPVSVRNDFNPFLN